MRRSIASFERRRREIADSVLLVARESLIEDFPPGIDHRLDQPISVERRIWRGALGATGVMKPAFAMDGFHPRAYKRGQALGEMEQAILDAAESFLFRGHQTALPSKSKARWVSTSVGRALLKSTARSSRCAHS